MGDPRVLIVGAGPTGLVLALWLAKAGVPFRLVDRNPGPARASRVMALQARTLEFYRQLGIADAAVAAGFRLDCAHLRNRTCEVAAMPYACKGIVMDTGYDSTWSYLIQSRSACPLC